jgi:hypothetical protein
MASRRTNSKNSMTGYRSFAACAYDLSMLSRIESALRQLFRSDSLYNKVGTAARCLPNLHPDDFPKEAQDDVRLLFSVFRYLQYSEHHDYVNSVHIPPTIVRKWFPTLLRLYGILMFAKGAASVLPIGHSPKIDEACRENAAAFFVAVKNGSRQSLPHDTKNPEAQAGHIARARRRNTRAIIAPAPPSPYQRTVQCNHCPRTVTIRGLNDGSKEIPRELHCPHCNGINEVYWPHASEFKVLQPRQTASDFVEDYPIEEA